VRFTDALDHKSKTIQMPSNIEDLLRPGDALIVVDVQNDFCPGGALPIEQGDQVVSVLNGWITAATAQGAPIYASRDWHPAGHISFKEHGGLWPPHCLQDTPGALFHPELKLPDSVVKITKGVRFDQDQNSVFDQTGLAYQLRRDGIRRLWVGGLAEDVCVLATVLDGRREGFEIVVIENATRAVTPAGAEQARRQMRAAGARLESAP
jgi:nicotinamidase/pyrazinamidase